eukprot:TRINITY_DN8466_c0_g2_i3.p2 TRINITY_DN8466_c0_g2~~TRINITY_DN8466_c0_g2_i3.p2  ORF type:complete len:159 (+),score=16.93 TRINITY_DN8466_c0_g2_i3:861-1337(+)
MPLDGCIKLAQVGAETSARRAAGACAGHITVRLRHYALSHLSRLVFHAGVFADPELAENYFLMGHNDNDIESGISLALHYLEDQSFQTQKEGVDVLFGLADRNVPDALYYLSTCYARGVGVEANAEHARGMLQDAADMGHIQAKQELDELNKESSSGL